MNTTQSICEVCKQNAHDGECSSFDLKLRVGNLAHKYELLQKAFIQQIEEHNCVHRTKKENLEDQVSDLKRALENIAEHATWAMGTLLENGIDTSIEDRIAEYEASNT